MEFSFPIIAHPNELPSWHHGDGSFYVYRQLTPAKNGGEYASMRRGPVLMLRLMNRFGSGRFRAQAEINTGLTQEIALELGGPFHGEEMDVLAEFMSLCKLEESMLRKNYYADLVDEVDGGHAFLAALADEDRDPEELSDKLDLYLDQVAAIGKELKKRHHFFARQQDENELNPGCWMLLPHGEIALAAMNERQAARI